MVRGFVLVFSLFMFLVCASDAQANLSQLRQQGGTNALGNQQTNVSDSTGAYTSSPMLMASSDQITFDVTVEVPPVVPEPSTFLLFLAWPVLVLVTERE